MDEASTAVRKTRGAAAADPGPEYRVRARFYAISQADGEPAYDWYRRVRAAAVPCRFGGPDRSAATVADKFVTGLLPGPVADRLLGERADRSPEDLLAVAVAAEASAARRRRGRRRNAAGADDGATAAAGDGATTAVAAAVDGSTDALIDELREGLKMYRYSDDDAARNRTLYRTNNEYNKKSPLEPNENILNGNMKSTHNEKMWWKNKIEKKSKQHGPEITSMNSEEYDDKKYYETSCYGSYKCYCCSLIYK